MASTSGDDGNPVTSQAMLLDLARCSGMYGAIIAGQTNGASSSLPPPPPPSAQMALQLQVPPTHPLQVPTNQERHSSVLQPHMLSNEAAMKAGPKHSGESSSAPSERAKRKKLMRQGQKDLLLRLDSLLHVGNGSTCAPSSAHKNVLEAALDAASAGRSQKASRVLGRDGRTLHNIIEDAIIKIRTIKTLCGQGQGAGTRGLVSGDVARSISHRDGLLSGNSLWTLELELPDFKVVAMSEAVKEWMDTPARNPEAARADEGVGTRRFLTPSQLPERTSVGLPSETWVYLCEVVHPDDEFALRKIVADQKLCGSRISLRLFRRVLEEKAARISAQVSAAAQGGAAVQEADLAVCKEKAGKRQAGKRVCKGTEEKKEGVRYLKVDMLLGGIASDSQRLVLVGSKVSDAGQIVHAFDIPASLEQQQQRWQKREQRQQRVQAQEQQQHKALRQADPWHLATHKDGGMEGLPVGRDGEADKTVAELKADTGGPVPALLSPNLHASDPTAAAAASANGQSILALVPGKTDGGWAGTNELSAAASKSLASLQALLSASAAGDGGLQATGLEAGGLAPLLASMQYPSLQQQAIPGDESTQQPQRPAPVAGPASAAPMGGGDSGRGSAGSAANPGVLVPGSDNFIQYLSAIAALSVQGGSAAAALAAGLDAGASGGDAGETVQRGPAPGDAGKTVAKERRGKKSSPFEAEEVEVAATLALLRNQPNAAHAAALQARSAALAVATGIGRSCGMSELPAAGPRGSDASTVGIKREREQALDCGVHAGCEVGGRAVAKSAEGTGDEIEPGAIMDDRETRRMRRKKMRRLQKTLAVELDLLLPRLGANNKSYKWAGRRSVGRTGRSLVEILVDTTKSVRKIREAKGMNALSGDAAVRSAGGGAHAVGSTPGAVGHTAFYKQGLLASRSLAIVEISVPDLGLLECSHAFQTCLRALGTGAAHPQNFGDMLSRNDVLALHAFLQKGESSAFLPIRLAVECAPGAVGERKARDAGPGCMAQGQTHSEEEEDGLLHFQPRKPSTSSVACTAEGEQGWSRGISCHAQLMWLCPHVSRAVLVILGMDSSGPLALVSTSNDAAASCDHLHPALETSGTLTAKTGPRSGDEVPPPPPLNAAANLLSDVEGFAGDGHDTSIHV